MVEITIQNYTLTRLFINLNINPYIAATKMYISTSDQLNWLL